MIHPAPLTSFFNRLAMSSEDVSELENGLGVGSCLRSGLINGIIHICQVRIIEMADALSIENSRLSSLLVACQVNMAAWTFLNRAILFITLA